MLVAIRTAEGDDEFRWCCLTFELTWRQRHGTKPATQIMHACTVARALCHAVGSQVERGVRRRFAVVACGLPSANLPVTYLCRTLAMRVWYGMPSSSALA
jgi:hypothetical protein